jgi:hypothetical protein
MCMLGGRHRCGAKLMKCKRCKAAYYCSKSVRSPVGNSTRLCNQFRWLRIVLDREASQILPCSLLIKSNYCSIAKEVYKKTQNTTSPRGAVVEIDFYGDAPALQNKIRFCCRLSWNRPS